MLSANCRCISLSLGREPTFPMRHGHDPDSIQDSMDDNDLWEPYFVDPANRPISLLAYPPIPPRRSATFRAFAKLCLVGRYTKAPATGSHYSDSPRHHHPTVLLRSDPRYCGSDSLQVKGP